MTSLIYLSHILEEATPSYGNKNPLRIERVRSMCCGDLVNDSYLHLSAHLGTHIDMPLHFHQNGQSIKKFDAEFWCFDQPILIEIIPENFILYEEIIDALKTFQRDQLIKCDILIVKTGIGSKRNRSDFWEKNPGFSPELYTYLKKHMPALKVLGFDSISLSSFQFRELGREAHQKFLNPDAPILPLEDMKLDELNSKTTFQKIIISPLRINNCDGLPCTVLGWRND